MMACIMCHESTREGFAVGLMAGLCERCADRMIECDHDRRDDCARQETRFDQDGIGYRVSICTLCGFEDIDEL